MKGLEGRKKQNNEDVFRAMNIPTDLTFGALNTLQVYEEKKETVMTRYTFLLILYHLVTKSCHYKDLCRIKRDLISYQAYSIP